MLSCYSYNHDADMSNKERRSKQSKAWASMQEGKSSSERFFQWTNICLQAVFSGRLERRSCNTLSYAESARN